ncbi:hypothetical protein [Flavobacterium caeni]|uniref:Uncharacterized protein n=1 Tax=Flavobacterium caeni TaxID=490189 RepID=A0A1G5D6E2_9FLAO|nr:hypothetical protein [Flavobacterium caeni]SCY10194.1 hypothetical protein SAMN02927903_00763 [Flavobacterium caeni]
MEPHDKRKIDDPGLNQDATYDKKFEEDFDNSDDFHKNDDTALDDRHIKTPPQNNNEGKFDGNIAI